MTGTYEINIRAKGGVDKYPAKSHARRVAQELGHNVSVIVLRGEKTANFSHSDQSRPFRQDRYFYYLTGSNDPDCWITYHVRSDTLTLWLPPIDTKRAFFDGFATTVEEALERYDIDQAKYLKGKKARCNLCQYIFNAAQTGQCAVAKVPRFFIGPKLMSSLNEESFTLGLLDAMDACRAVKDEHEIAMIRKANDVSTKAHVTILKTLHQLKSETQVEAVYTAACLSEKAREQAYEPICASGPNASQLHYNTNLEDFGDRATLLVDAGAEWKCYASDVTRTVPINPKEPGHWRSDEAKQIYKCVEHIQDSCIAKIKPGLKYQDLMMYGVELALDAMLEIGLLKGDRAEIFKAGTWRAFYPHGLGHYLGLEVHDVSPPKEKRSDSNKSNLGTDLGNVEISEMLRITAQHAPGAMASMTAPADEPLVPGMVITVEPGLYFNRKILAQFFLNNPAHSKYIDRKVLHKYMHVGGVRIEDDILVTERGHENLTTTPKGEEALKIMREAAAEAAIMPIRVSI